MRLVAAAKPYAGHLGGPSSRGKFPSIVDELHHDPEAQNHHGKGSHTGPRNPSPLLSHRPERFLRGFRFPKEEGALEAPVKDSPPLPVRISVLLDQL